MDEWTYQKGRPATCDVRARLVLRKLQTKMGSQVLLPAVELPAERPQFRNGNVVVSVGGVQVLQGLVQDPRRGEQRDRTGDPGGFTGQRRQETRFGDIFVINVLGVLGANVPFAEEDG